MDILVTGGCGTIGSVLSYLLRAKGHDVWTCDLVHCRDERHVRCDVAEYRQLSMIFEKHRFDLVYHLAAEFGRWNGEEYYEQMWRSNVIGTKNILRLQERLGFRLVFSSSSEVYGDAVDTMTEDLMDRQEIRQLNDYAISKWVNELQILNAAAMSGVSAVRVRLFNTYGPGEFFTPYRSAICRFAYCALLDKPYTVYLDHRRSSIFIRDAVTTLAMFAEVFHPGEVFNIGGARSHTMKEVSDLVLAQCCRDDSLVVYAREEPFTTRDKRIDIGKATGVLGHNPLVPLEEGIRRTVAWMRRVYVEKSSTDPFPFIGLDV